MFLKPLLVSFGLIGCGVPALAAPSAEALAELLLRKSGAPGVAVAYWKDGTSQIAARGLRVKGGDAPVTTDDLWHIGSVTKSMTATLVARLVERGVIAWDDTIGGTLGHLIDEIPAPLADVNYQTLLDHRAGLAKDIPPEMEEEMWQPLSERDIRADRLRYATDILLKGAQNPPGSRFAYSNAGYVIVGAMLEERTGKTWEQLIRDEVFAPLGMDSAGFGPPPQGNPWGHMNPRLRRLKPMPPDARGDNPPVFGPAGTVHLSMADLLRYLRAHLAEPETFLSNPGWAQLHQPRAGVDYGAGWFFVSDTQLGHDGSNTLWYTHVEIDLSARSALILQTNSGADFWTQRALRAAIEQFHAN